MNALGLRIFIKLLGCIALCLLVPVAYGQSAPIGQEIINVADIEYTQSGDRIVQTIGPASITVQARRTSSVIKFHHIAANAPDAQTVTLNGSDYSPSGSLGGPFLPINTPDEFFESAAGSKTHSPQKQEVVTVSLIEAVAYQSEDVVIVSVEDPGQNGDPLVIERIATTIAVSGGDRVVLQLYEGGPDEGVFYAYIQTTAQLTPAHDDKLSILSEDLISASYSDSFDNTETSMTTARLNASSIVINSFNGTPVNDVSITLIDDATGAPAHVYGINGIAEFPSTITSGGIVSDSLGNSYEFETGEFFFPTVIPGRYRLEVTPPAGYSFPSLVTELGGTPLEFLDISATSYGEPFDVVQTGPLVTAVPLDVASNLILQKTTQTQVAAIGDFVSYSISVENRGDQRAALKLRDVAPKGFRLEDRSVSVSAGTVSVESRNGTTNDFEMSPLEIGESVTLSYVMQVGAGAENGEALNTAYIVNSFDKKISNSAEAQIYIQEDLLKSRGNIVGLVSEAMCGPGHKGKAAGVEGVRIYMETGAYVVSDERGMFHFENLKPGTHVVQIDDVSLPDGYAAQTCAGEPMDLSKFVDLTGGTIWRAEFELKKINGDDSLEKTANSARAKTAGRQPEYLNFDEIWLNAQPNSVGWAYPDPALTPSSKSIHIGIKHAENHSVKLFLNGNPVPPENLGGRVVSSKTHMALTRWRGVDIQNGENVFEVKILDHNQSVISNFEKSIWYVTEATRAAYAAESSHLIADGRTAPEIAVRIMNGSGKPVHAGRIVGVDVESPYRLQLANNLERQAGISQSLASRGGVSVGKDGLAKIKLEPTLNTGYVTLKIKMDDHRTEIIRAYLTPEKREWFIVGMAETRAEARSSHEASKNTAFEDVFSRGRIAVYAKGNVLSDWLLTIGIDTDRKRSDDEIGFHQEIDPNAGYLIYGDRSYQQIDAQSRYPVFARLEKDGVQALFGDFNTDLNTTELSQYSRQLSGLKFVADTKHVLVNMFASEARQGFNKDELAADGTSGPYHLSAYPVLNQSETVTIQVRDRLRSDEILNSRTMVRYLDYELNSRTGELIFRQPVDVTDAELNPQVIVVDYETPLAIDRNITYGGRAALKFKDGRAEVGASYISESGAGGRPDVKSKLYGVDATVEPVDGARIKAEYAQTETHTENGTVKGSAALIEGEYQTEKLALRGYYRRENTGFGLGQQTSNTENIQRYGVRASHRLAQSDDGETLRRSSTMLEAEAYREENLATGRSRDVVDAKLTREGSSLKLDTGFKYVKEDLGSAPDRKSMLLTAGAQKALENIGANLFIRHEQPIAGDNDSSLFPHRTLLGADKSLTDRLTLNLRHEFLIGENVSGHNTRFGVTYKPWTGADVRTQFDHVTQGSLRRLGATFGVDQTILINDKWSASLGGARRALIDGTHSIEAIVPDAANGPIQAVPESALTGSDGYAAYYLGLQRQTDHMTASTRAEYRDSLNEQRYTLQVAAARQIQADLSFAGSGRFEVLANEATGQESNRGDISLGLSYRPRENAPVIFDRLDYRFENRGDGTKTQKLINNFALNADLWTDLQASVFLGTKFAQTTTTEGTFESWTHLLGGEQRFKISDKFDIGYSGSLLYADGAGTVQYAHGPNIGYAPHNDIWISAGWNLTGFRDEDFEAAEYSREGPYITLRAKFDQNTMKGLLDRVSW